MSDGDHVDAGQGWAPAPSGRPTAACSDGSRDGSTATGLVLAVAHQGQQRHRAELVDVAGTDVRVLPYLQLAGRFGLSGINIINDPAAMAYRDETPQLGVTYSYRIGAVTPTGQEVSVTSRPSPPASSSR